MKIEHGNRSHLPLLAEINHLLSQLSSSARPLSATELGAVMDSDTPHLLLATDDGRLCGMLTLVVFRIPTGIRAWIEDVVVNDADRGKGVAKTLLEAAIEQARSMGAKTLDLTSRPAREAANRLYRKVGFVQRETNVYRIET